MPRYAANLSMLYPERAFLDRFAAAARDEFAGVEYLFPYAHSPRELASRLRDLGLEQVLFNAPPGGEDADGFERAWAAGDRGTACAAGREPEFRLGVEWALRYAEVLGCPRVHVMAGRLPGTSTREAARAVLADNMRWAARLAAGSGIELLIEAINTRDIPGFIVNRQDDAHALVQDIGAPNVKVQFDLYHCQIVEGDVAMKIRRDLPTGRVGHIQIAGVPERHEPDVGELNGPYLMGVLDEVAAGCGWQGWVGCEYRPAADTSAGLGWMRGSR